MHQLWLVLAVCLSQRHIVFPPAPVLQGIAEQRRKLLPYTIRPDRSLHYLRPERLHALGALT